MSMPDTTTLVCLFHHTSQAQAAVDDLYQAGIPQGSVSMIGGEGATVDALDKSELASLGMPDRDYDHLKSGIREGGVVVSVSPTPNHVGTVESIFAKHQAKKIDDVESNRNEGLLAAAPLAAAPVAETGADTIPVIAEDLVVGKRTVDQGGVRLYRRVVEVPVEEAVQLREEHVTVDRVAVDRPVTNADLAFQPRTVELTETAEEAVVMKDARVVEEVLVGKEAVERTETIRDTVRHTEVVVEELPATGGTTDRASGRTF